MKRHDLSYRSIGSPMSEPSRRLQRRSKGARHPGQAFWQSRGPSSPIRSSTAFRGSPAADRERVAVARRGRPLPLRGRRRDAWRASSICLPGCRWSARRPAAVAMFSSILTIASWRSRTLGPSAIAVEALRDRNIPREFVRARTLGKALRASSADSSRSSTVSNQKSAEPGRRQNEWTFSGAPFHKWKPVEEHLERFPWLASARQPAAQAETSASRRSTARSGSKRSGGRTFTTGVNAARRSSPHRLVTFVGEQDSDILPFFLDHYRRLGIEEFHVAVHGYWSQERTGTAPRRRRHDRRLRFSSPSTMCF